MTGLYYLTLLIGHIKFHIFDLLNLPKYELTLIKGTRFHFPVKNRNIPFDRRLGSFLLEPLSRMCLVYKGLTDISNGFISMNQITLK